MPTLETDHPCSAFAEKSSAPEARREGTEVLILLVIATLVCGAIGFEIGLIYGWIAAAVGAQLGATAGVLVVATVQGLR